MGERAVFLDRDGTLNELVFYERFGELDSPAGPDDVRLKPGVGEAIQALRSAGWQIALISNQPGVAKDKFSYSTFEAIDRRFVDLLQAQGAEIPHRYYCMHHPDAVRAEYRVACDCRKPQPGLVLRAAAELGVGLPESVVIGDSYRDVAAGRAAGCLTILVGEEAGSELARLRLQGVEPNLVAPDLPGAVKLLLQGEEL